MTQAGPSLLAGNEVSYLSSLGLGLRTRFPSTALRELHIFAQKVQRHVLVLTILGGKESKVQREPFAVSRGMEGSKLEGAGAFSIQKQMICHSPFHSGEKKPTKCALARSCFHSSVELNHILNLYVCTKQIFVFWSFITFTIISQDAATSPGHHAKGMSYPNSART